MAGRRTPSRRDRAELAERLLDRYGETYAHEAGFTVKDTPSPLYRLLCLATLLAARIRAGAAVSAARALADAGWTTVDKMRASTWEERVRVLNRSGYARYDESTARVLGDAADTVHERWGGDLRRLRDEAGRQPDAERRLLQEVKGIGEVGAHIFCREVQGTWDELAPFVDDRAAASASRLGLPTAPDELAALAPDGPDGMPRLVAALVRVDLDDGYDAVIGG